MGTSGLAFLAVVLIFLAAVGATSLGEQQHAAQLVELLSSRGCISTDVASAVDRMREAHTATALQLLASPPVPGRTKAATKALLLKSLPQSGRSPYGAGFISTPAVPCVPQESKYWTDGPYTAIQKDNHCCNNEPAIVKCPGNRILELSRQGTTRADEPVVCQAHLPVPRSAGGRGCALLSFGIAGQWSFETALARHGCDVHAFDPTISSRSMHEEQSAHIRARLDRSAGGNMSFHFAGLTGGAADTASQRGDARSSYGAVAWERMITLPDAVRGFVRDKRATLVLKLDCEGCEWGAFDHAARIAPELLGRFDLIILEVHVVESLLMSSKGSDGLRMFASFYRELVEKRGFRLSYLHENPGGFTDRAVHPELLRLGLKPSMCCYEIVLVNPRFHH
ncbi:hypothetical protein T492DRAFT_950872 [Pavlovales sp. CCMP2436]|nr:hypothetical protein T492DRAFT_950872 [Pavlovales sp. CCMP2436]